MKIVTLGNGKQIPLGEYVRAWQRVRDIPAATKFEHGLCGWWPVTADELRREFREGLHDRINRRAPGYGKGRKWDQDWQREVGQAARRLNTPRLRVYATEVPGWLRERVADRLADRRDD